MTEQTLTQIRHVIDSAAFKTAAATLAAEHDRTVADIIDLTETPAPPFKERTRAEKWCAMAKAHGLEDVEIDEEGNVTGLRRGIGNGRLICIAAHLDTVFPEGTEVTVRREGTKLFAPGVGDDTRSLAVLLAWMRALDAAAIQTRNDILFVADVGEEGAGDLRGMRHLFGKGRYKDRISAFITVDSPEVDRIAIGGVGSKRYRVTFDGPGGHSYGAFGVVNPMFAMADATARFGKLVVPAKPKTTFSASVTGGGTSINAIPNSVWMEFDLRSESAAELAKLEAQFIVLLDRSVAAENAARSTANGPVTYTLTPIGDRPAGNTPEDSELVQLAHAAISAHGYQPRFVSSSTDANIAMSLGIPALRIGSGGTGGRGHSLEEWIDVEPTQSIRGMTAGLATVLAAAGMA
ncbi:M20/M25/M40 family metallo-hydrolase [Acidisphaera sp. L21]|uniref:M20/M25/M40 family metallo-hydrolase n=1 Tax=Acidisphaera sp. L21 TaxID=1641851 RepID=UPI00131E5C07|nr:M20/M25/M40 family metallo-hydrolase [Acidisphaera sp. L21]